MSHPKQLQVTEVALEMNMVFNVGDHVEVIGSDEDFIGSYYQAKVISDLDHDGRYEVQYMTLAENEETWDHLKEKLLPHDIRPMPPRIGCRDGFKVNQSVDVYDNNGWWNGTITGKVPSVGLYYVYFSSTNETLGFRFTRIRVHLELIDGRWCKMVTD